MQGKLYLLVDGIEYMTTKGWTFTGMIHRHHWYLWPAFCFLYPTSYLRWWHFEFFFLVFSFRIEKRGVKI